MKSLCRILLALSVIALLAGCSLTGPLSPPAWIIGTWEAQDQLMIWEFTADNAISTVGGMRTDYREMDKYLFIKVSDSSTASTYEITVGSLGVRVTDSFTKVDDQTLDYVQTGESSVTLTKQ